jgi:hypothetical protein
MSNYWDEFLEESLHDDYPPLPRDRRALLKMFYLWLVQKGVIA